MTAKHNLPTFRSARLSDAAPLDYAPDSEQGAVFLFSHLARSHFGLRIEQVQSGYPDCVAFLGSKRVRIEFECRSRNFAVHRHDLKKCDCVVCWLHDWTTAPRRHRIIELRREFGLGFNVWLILVGPEYKNHLAEVKLSSRWSVLAKQRTVTCYCSSTPFRTAIYATSSEWMGQCAKLLRTGRRERTGWDRFAEFAR